MSIKKRIEKLEGNNKQGAMCCENPCKVIPQKECGNCGNNYIHEIPKGIKFETEVILPKVDEQLTELL